MTKNGVTLVNIMASPGAGKTSLLLKTIEAIRGRFRIGVIEADIDSTVDADKMIAAGVPAVQIRTGGFCHVEAAMASAALAEFTNEFDLSFLENVGNLICTAQRDTGAHINATILSVPEGDDKPLKYPLVFRDADAVIINKTDFLPLTDFRVESARERIRMLNRTAAIFELSCRTSAGIADWTRWLESRIPRSSGPWPS